MARQERLRLPRRVASISRPVRTRVDRDPLLELGACRELLLCEIESSGPALSLNRRLEHTAPLWTRSCAGQVSCRQRRSTPPVKKLLAAALQDTATLAAARAGVEVDVPILALLCCPGCSLDAEPTRWCVCGPDMLPYIDWCLNPSVTRLKCITRYSLELWGGFLAPLVVRQSAPE